MLQHFIYFKMLGWTLSGIIILLSVISETNGAKLGNRNKRASESGKLVVCYYPNWSQYRSDEGKFVVSDIDPFLCTHILYAFAKIVNGQLQPYEWNDFAMYEELRALKNLNPFLQTILSVGGATMGRGPFEDVSSTPPKRLQFASNVVNYLTTHGFDGVDIDWEFPEAGDRENYREMLGELRKAFQLDAALTGHPEFLLSCALSAAERHITHSYDVPGIAQYVNFANIMAYDLHGSWDSVTGLHSALHGYESWDKFNQEWVVDMYLSLGLPPGKAVLGMPSYGRSFRLCESHNNGLRDCAQGAGDAGIYTRDSGILAYYEICLSLDDRWTKRYDEVQKAPYASLGNQWVGYDDPQSVAEKAAFASDLSLAGVMFWDLSMDDFSGLCGDGEFPLIKAAKSAELPTTRPSFGFTRTTPSMGTRSSRRPYTTIATTLGSSSTTTSTTTPTQPGSICDDKPDLTFVRDPDDCSVYYQCVDGHAYMFQCPNGLYFDTVISVCNWDFLVDC